MTLGAVSSLSFFRCWQRFYGPFPSPYRRTRSTCHYNDRTCPTKYGLLQFTYGKRFLPAKPSVVDETSCGSQSPSAQPRRYASLIDSYCERIGESERGRTSEPQDGHLYTPSGRRRISGWPHSQAWLPMAPGSATICSRVSSTSLLIERLHLVQ